MTDVAVIQKLKAPADEVWDLVGGFNSLPEFDPTSAWSELEAGGKDRRVGVTGGGVIVERLLLFDEKARCYSYTITELIDLVFPFDNYLSTIRVLDDEPGKTCILHWSGSGDPIEGFTGKDIEEELRKLYQGIADTLAKRYGS